MSTSRPLTAGAEQAGGRWPDVAAAMLALHGVVALCFAVFYLARTSDAFATFNVLGSTLLFVLGAAGLLYAARGLHRRRRWARSPALTWGIICLPVAYGLFQSGRWYVGLPVTLSAVLILRGLFAVPGQR